MADLLKIVREDGAPVGFVSASHHVWGRAYAYDMEGVHIPETVCRRIHSPSAFDVLPNGFISVGNHDGVVHLIAPGEPVVFGLDGVSPFSAIMRPFRIVHPDCRTVSPFIGGARRG